jgi:iron complex outermembrane receptor protein
MNSPFAAARGAADGARAWDGLIAALSGLNPVLGQIAPALMGPGAVGDPALVSQLLRLNRESGQFEADTGPRNIARLQATTTSTLEMGYKGLIADKLAISFDVYSSTIQDFVGPLRVETPSVFLSAASIQAFVEHRLAPVIQSGELTTSDVTAIVAQLAQVPLGTVSPDGRADTDLLLTSRNFGDVSLCGVDVGFQLHASSKLILDAAFSFVSDECFEVGVGGDCSGGAVALNAPTVKGSLGARYHDALSGLAVGGRVRYSDAFAMNSGVYYGQVDSYAVVDAHMSYKLPTVPGATVSLVATNLLDNLHQEFIGAPFIGRLGMVRLDYTF